MSVPGRRRSVEWKGSRWRWRGAHPLRPKVIVSGGAIISNGWAWSKKSYNRLWPDRKAAEIENDPCFFSRAIAQTKLVTVALADCVVSA